MRHRSNDEMLTIFDWAGITNKTERLPWTGGLFEGGWTVVETHKPAIDQIEMDSMTVVTIDCRSRAGN